MRFENTGIEDTVIDVQVLDHVTANLAFIRAGQWDYERVTYDYKIGSNEKTLHTIFAYKDMLSMGMSINAMLLLN